jgi:RNA polymerase sigma factor (TIGR02999 family)
MNSSSESQGDLTQLLKRVTEQDPHAYGELLPRVYDAMRQMAGGYIQRERADHTLQPTALVHEAFLKLIDHDGATYEDRRHFMAIAARAMRQILVDYARRRSAAKRGGGLGRVTLDEGLMGAKSQAVDLVALEDALQELKTLDSRKSQVVELRFFGGMTNQDVAVVLGMSPKTTEADWYMARAFLRRALSENQGET